MGRAQLRGGSWVGLRNTDPTSVSAGSGTVLRGAQGRGAAGDPIPVAGGVGPLPTAGREAPGWEGASGIPLPAQPTSAASMGPAPSCTIGRTTAGPRQGPPCGSAETREPESLTCAAASQRAPSSALSKLRPGPFPQPRIGGGADDGARPIRSGLPELLANPRRASKGRVDPTETFQRDRSASSGSSRTPLPRAVAQWTFPARLGCGRLYHRRAA